MYKIIALISVIIRQFCLPNPFDCFGAVAELLNWIAEPIMHIVVFATVGVFYDRGTCPPLGALLYLGVYSLITFCLWVLGQFSFAWWAVAIMIAVIVGIMILFSKIRGDFY